MDNYEVNVLTRKGGWKKLPQEVIQNKDELKLDASDNLVDTDISSQPAKVQAICNAVWTDSLKSSYKAFLIYFLLAHTF